MTCPGCHTRSGAHEPGCPAGALLPVVLSHLPPRPPVALPHLNLVQIVRDTRSAYGRNRPGSATDGDGIATLLTCAAIQAIRAGVDPHILAEMFTAIVKIVDEEEP